MNITIIGSGHVGRALGDGWRKAGHSITFAAREPAGTKAAELKKAGFTVVATADAARSGDVIVVATPWDAVPATFHALGPLAGMIVVDATNPLTAKLELALGFSDSAGETVARLASGARVVKAFNTTGANNMADSKYPGRQTDDAGRGRRRGGEADSDVACVRTRIRADRCRPARHEPPP